MNHLQTADWLAEILDSKIKVGPFGFGLDPLLNFIPLGGTMVAMLLSLYIVWISRQLHTPTALRTRMVFNVVIDTILGLIPGVGWAADFIFHANTRNLNLLHQWLDQQPLEGQIRHSRIIGRQQTL